MPVIDLYLPRNTFGQEQTDRLAERLSDSLKQCKHAIDNPRADAIN